jgi:hypothetical protein
LLDPLCAKPTSVVGTIDHGLTILRPSPAFCDIIQNLHSQTKEIVRRATLFAKAEAMRGPGKKRSTPVDLSDDDEEPAVKRSLLSKGDERLIYNWCMHI